MLEFSARGTSTRPRSISDPFLVFGVQLVISLCGEFVYNFVQHASVVWHLLSVLIVLKFPQGIVWWLTGQHLVNDAKGRRHSICNSCSKCGRQKTKQPAYCQKCSWFDSLVKKTKITESKKSQRKTKGRTFRSVKCLKYTQAASSSHGVFSRFVSFGQVLLFRALHSSHFYVNELITQGLASSASS